MTKLRIYHYIYVAIGIQHSLLTLNALITGKYVTAALFATIVVMMLRLTTLNKRLQKR